LWDLKPVDRASRTPVRGLLLATASTGLVVGLLGGYGLARLEVAPVAIVTPETAPTALHVAPTPAPPSAAPASTVAMRRVQPGDTLCGIAQDTYGDPSRFGLLIAANPGIRPRALRIGTLLRVPAPTPTDTSRSKP
jgi:nucleoid-associated protein YgaU